MMPWGKLRKIILHQRGGERRVLVPSVVERRVSTKLATPDAATKASASNRPGGWRSHSFYKVVHYVLRLLILIACFIGCFAQIGTIMKLFFSYPAIVFVDLQQMEKLLLPGITICNENRVMRSKLKAFDADFANKWNILLNRSHHHANTALKLYQQQLIDKLIRKMLTNLTVSEFMTYGNTADDFLDVNFFRCASDKNHPTQKCIFLSNLFTTAQENGNCFTLFHKSKNNVLETIAINSGLSESAVVRGSVNESVNIEMSIKSFAPNEIMRVRVNFQENEYTTLNEPVSGRFIIHDNKQIAVIRQKSYRIEPGKYYIFYISKLTDELLPAPYVTNCRDYDKTEHGDGGGGGGGGDKGGDQSGTAAAAAAAAETKSGLNETINLLLNTPASKANCIMGCVAKQTIKTCNCWPPELPFFFTGATNASENALRWCDWREKPPISNWKDKPSHLTWFQYCFNVHEEACNQECKADCRIDRYTILKEEMDWPSKERIDHSDDKNELRELHSCCAIISIRYWSAEQTINKYRPRLETAEFTSYIGGLLSMWLGFSLFGFYGLSEKTMLNAINYIMRKRHARQERKRMATSAGSAGGQQTLAKVVLGHRNSQTSLLLKSNKVRDSSGGGAASEPRKDKAALVRQASNWTTMYSRRLRNHSSDSSGRVNMSRRSPHSVYTPNSYLSDISHPSEPETPSAAVRRRDNTNEREPDEHRPREVAPDPIRRHEGRRPPARKRHLHP